MPIKKTNKRCLRVGITGGIGSGKTTVCRIFNVLGIPVYDADHWAKWLISNDLEIKSALVKIFGPEAYTAEGAYNRPFVANIVFNDPEKLAQLNAAVHPAVEKHSQVWHLEQAAKGLPYTLKEAALLVESKGHTHLDALIVVTAPEALRVERVMRRDRISAAEVRARLKNQLPQKEKEALADFLIVNDGLQLLVPQVWNVHQTLVARAVADF